MSAYHDWIHLYDCLHQKKIYQKIGSFSFKSSYLLKLPWNAFNAYTGSEDAIGWCNCKALIWDYSSFLHPLSFLQTYFIKLCTLWNTQTIVTLMNCLKSRCSSNLFLLRKPLAFYGILVLSIFIIDLNKTVFSPTLHSTHKKRSIR